MGSVQGVQPCKLSMAWIICKESGMQESQQNYQKLICRMSDGREKAAREAFYDGNLSDITCYRPPHFDRWSPVPVRELLHIWS